ncbi:MAG: hypothetical protein COB66_01560 [Coxiella sp. (in: Bacteria)]|nr:MAG: hypothetical protein COB66_01560 [Coxiella sp. (in: g-proteobacteria)]
MTVLNKIRRNGLNWFFRRVMREVIQPTTWLGRCIRPFANLLNVILIKPVNVLRRMVSSDAQKISKKKDTLYFFYDFEVEPVTYDFVWDLCMANAEREKLGLAYLHIVFVPGEQSGLRHEVTEYEKVVDLKARNLRIYNLLLPALALLPCQYSMSFYRARSQAALELKNHALHRYPKQYSVLAPVPCNPGNALQYRQSLMGLRADKDACKHVSIWLKKQAGNKKVIVITLRDYHYGLPRNSNVPAWIEFSKSLDAEKFFVIFVPDTETVLMEGGDKLREVTCFELASWNINMRAALSELAYLNLGVNTGPMALCWLNARSRYITFKILAEGTAATKEEMEKRGFTVGVTPNFANKFQKWVWEDDDLECIHREFWKMCALLDSHKTFDHEHEADVVEA